MNFDLLLMANLKGQPMTWFGAEIKKKVSSEIGRPKSVHAYEELQQRIPGGVNSPVRSFSGLDRSPLIVDSAFQDCITDIDGNTYVDFCCSWGALIHGHAHPTLIEAVYHRLMKGSSYGITSQIECDMAKKVCQLTGIEKIRFVSSGTEATMSAVRLSRGYTGRDTIIKFSGCYHGHADYFLVQAGSGVINIGTSATSKGIPKDSLKTTVCLPYNDTEAFLKWLKTSDMAQDLAAIIVEPIAGNMGVIPAKPEFLNALREETLQRGAILILDEVITGFRVSLKGFQGIYAITPDLTCYGKILGGGFPVAAFGGKKEIMDYLAPLGPVYQAGTLSGNPVAMEAGFQSLSLLEEPQFYTILQKKADLLLEPIQEYIKKKSISACLNSVGSMFTLFFGKKEVENMDHAKQSNRETFKCFFQFMFDHGIYWSPSQHEACFISMAHDEKHLIRTRDLVIDFLKTHYTY